MITDINRDSTVDVLRGFAIFLVVFGHIIHVPEARAIIWGFHMPIFFFLSGYLFNSSNTQAFYLF